MEKTYKAMVSESLSGKYDPRYVIVSTETGKVLDDAQGYGYKSAQKAYAAFAYKNRSPKDIEKRKKKKERQADCRLVQGTQILYPRFGSICI